MELTVPVIGILGGIPSDFFGPLMDAAFANGLQAIEVTFNTVHVEKIIARQRPCVPEGKLLGMGTIRNMQAIAKQRPEDIGHNVSAFLTALNTSRLKIAQTTGDTNVSSGN